MCAGCLAAMHLYCMEPELLSMPKEKTWLVTSREKGSRVIDDVIESVRGTRVRYSPGYEGI